MGKSPRELEEEEEILPERSGSGVVGSQGAAGREQHGAVEVINMSC